MENRHMHLILHMKKLSHLQKIAQLVSVTAYVFFALFQKKLFNDLDEITFVGFKNYFFHTYTVI